MKHNYLVTAKTDNEKIDAENLVTELKDSGFDVDVKSAEDSKVVLETGAEREYNVVSLETQTLKVLSKDHNKFKVTHEVQ